MDAYHQGSCVRGHRKAHLASSQSPSVVLEDVVPVVPLNRFVGAPHRLQGRYTARRADVHTARQPRVGFAAGNL